MRLLLGLIAPLLFAAPPTFRLPEGVKPVRYSLELTVDPRQPVFHGTVRIEAEIANPTDLIWLNAKELEISDARVLIGTQRLTAKPLLADEFLGLQLTSPVGPGRATLEIRFQGTISDKRNSGLYRKSSGSDWYAFTTFTPIDARRAFPCFDEPAYKAPWSVVLHVPKDAVAAANNPAVSEQNEANGLKRVEFSETLPLPSEVVAIAVGPFDVIDAGVAGRNKIPVRILTPKGRGGEAEGARLLTRDVVEKLEDYTGIPYPWAKLDQVAVLDMPFGAVENPGLITYRDRGLLAKPETDTPERRFRMRGTMAHELAHQWFGNLVTQAWWDDVWLSEGFATWLGTKINDLERPRFERGLAPVSAKIQIMQVDASSAARPVRLAMNSRKDTDDVYSGFVYQKAAAVLYMIEQWLGETPFRDGLRVYLQRHAHGTATTDDFAAALRSVAGVDPGPVLHSFLDRAGFPSLRAQCSDGHPELIANAEGWTAPVCSDTGCALMSGKNVALPGTCDGFVSSNRNGAGYFTLERTPGAVDQLIKTGWDHLTAPERLNFVNDLSVAAKRKLLDGETLRRALPVLARDPEPAVANAALRVLLSQASTSPSADRQKWGEIMQTLSEGGRRRR